MGAYKTIGLRRRHVHLFPSDPNPRPAGANGNVAFVPDSRHWPRPRRSVSGHSSKRAANSPRSSIDLKS